jgi:hypothetical protein
MCTQVWLYSGGYEPSVKCDRGPGAHRARVGAAHPQTPRGWGEEAASVRKRFIRALRNLSPTTSYVRTRTLLYMEKRCSKCGVVKPLEEFRRHKAGKRHAQCRECMAAWKRSRAPEVKAAERRRWKEANREKVRAQDALREAVRDGRLVRPDACVRCGAVGPVHGHHRDYAKRYDVVWLCVRCHADEHSQAA